MSKRPFRNVPTDKLKSAIGIGRAGLAVWKKDCQDYEDVKWRVIQMETELRIREEEQNATVCKPTTLG